MPCRCNNEIKKVLDEHMSGMGGLGCLPFTTVTHGSLIPGSSKIMSEMSLYDVVLSHATRVLMLCQFSSL